MSVEARLKKVAQAAGPPFLIAHHGEATVHSPRTPSSTHLHVGTIYS